MLDKNPKGKRRILTATPLLTLLVVALAVSLFANTATANPIGYYYPWSPPPAPIVKVVELNTDKLTLTFSAVKNGPWITPYGIGADYEHGPYCDWGDYEISTIHVWFDGKLWSSLFGSNPTSVSLEGLSNGWHTLEVTATATGMYQSKGYASLGSSGVIEFQVDTPPPSISVITGQKTFETSDIPLNFTVNRPVSWVGYSLDGNNVAKVTDDVASTEWFGVDNYQLVLSGLPAGAHSLTVHAEDLAGNRGASEPFTFTVTQETPSETEQASTPFPTTTTVAASAIIASAAVITFGLVAYFVRGNRKSSET